MINFSAIVSVSNNWVIGNDNKMPWHQSEDLKRFKYLTTNHIVIMGRKTFKSIGKVLPKRINVILTTDKNYKHQGCYVVHSVDEVLKLSTQLIENHYHIENEVFIIGGGEVYKQFLPLCNKLYITKLNCELEGDTHFPKIDDNWKLTAIGKYLKDEKNDFDYTFENYIRI